LQQDSHRGILGYESHRNAVPAGLRGPGIPDADELHVGVQSQGTPEAALNQKVKNLIQKLGEAIHESVSESENIAGVVKNIRDQGFDVMLMLEATIGLNQVDAESEESSDSSNEDQPGVFTRHDLSFLKSLRISLPDSEEEFDSGSESNNLRLDPPTETSGPPSGD
jgi:hypothetical protein